MTRYRKLFSLYTIRSFHDNAVIPGPIVDNYLPTDCSKRSSSITIFGSTGFFGNFLLKELSNDNKQIILGYRGDSYNLRSLVSSGNINQVICKCISLDDDEALLEAMKPSEIVINLVGREFETSLYPFDLVHVEFAARLARLATKLGHIKSFIHMSALGAHPAPNPVIRPSGSRYLKTKYQGEQEILREFPNCTIIRPATMWGYLDRFIYYYLSRKRRKFPYGKKIVIPLWKKGEETIKQPIYAGDVASVIGKLTREFDKFKGGIYELAGPQRFYLNHLVYWFYLNQRYEIDQINITSLSPFIIKLNDLKSNFGLIYPFMTSEMIERESISEKLTENDPSIRHMSELDIRPCRMEDRIEWLLKSHRGLGYSWNSNIQFHPPPSPPVAVDVNLVNRNSN